MKALTLVTAFSIVLYFKGIESSSSSIYSKPAPKTMRMYADITAQNNHYVTDEHSTSNTLNRESFEKEEEHNDGLVEISHEPLDKDKNYYYDDESEEGFDLFSGLDDALFNNQYPENPIYSNPSEKYGEDFVYEGFADLFEEEKSNNSTETFQAAEEESDEEDFAYEGLPILFEEEKSNNSTETFQPVKEESDEENVVFGGLADLFEANKLAQQLEDDSDEESVALEGISELFQSPSSEQNTVVESLAIENPSDEDNMYEGFTNLFEESSDSAADTISIISDDESEEDDTSLEGFADLFESEKNTSAEESVPEYPEEAKAYEGIDKLFEEKSNNEESHEQDLYEGLGDLFKVSEEEEKQEVKVNPSKPKKSGLKAKKANFVTAPLPGKVTRIYVKKGQTIKKGKKLFELEAMKMKINIAASASGKVQEIFVKVGDDVKDMDQLASY